MQTEGTDEGEEGIRPVIESETLQYEHMDVFMASEVDRPPPMQNHDHAKR